MARLSEKYSVRKLEQDFAYSHAIRTQSHLYLSGCVSWDENGNPLAPGNFPAQLRNIYDEIDRTLRAHGQTFESVVKETIYTVSMSDMLTAIPIRAGYYQGVAPPAATVVEVRALVHPDLLLEIEITAVIRE